MIARRRRENFCHLSALKCIFLNKNEGFPNDFESKSQNFRPSAEIMTFYENAPPLVARPPSNKGGGGIFIRGGHFHRNSSDAYSGTSNICGSQGFVTDKLMEAELIVRAVFFLSFWEKAKKKLKISDF